MPLDNSTLPEKVRLRRRILAHFQAAPLVLETHGGYGRIYERTWFKARAGVVFEKDPTKADHLARQRPNWAVYHGDCEKALAAGLARGTAFDIIDLDPYGQPFSVLNALALPGRAFPDEWHLVVNDGNRQKVQRGGSWHMQSLTAQVRKYGVNLYPIYLQVARECVEEFANKIGFQVIGWSGHYAGKNDMMTHYWAVLRRRAAKGRRKKAARAVGKPGVGAAAKETKRR